MKVSLRDVADAIDMCPEEGEAYLNIKTGECHTILPDDFGMDEEPDEEREATLPDWERESLAKNREVLGSEDWIELPPKFDFHEYRVMEDFCYCLNDGHAQQRLLQAIKGSGAFRRFKDKVHRLSIQDQWHKFRDERLWAFVAEWLDGKGIAYERGAGK